MSEYVDAIRKVLPAEVTAAFLAINTVLPNSDQSFWWVVGTCLLLTATCALYQYFIYEMKIILGVVFSSFILFPVWCWNIAIDRFDLVGQERVLPFVAIIIVNLMVPLVALKIKSGNKNP